MNAPLIAVASSAAWATASSAAATPSATAAISQPVAIRPDAMSRRAGSRVAVGTRPHGQASTAARGTVTRFRNT